jgi:hypothetical protein
MKTNATSGNASFDLAFGTYMNGVGLTEHMRIKDTGAVQLGDTGSATVESNVDVLTIGNTGTGQAADTDIIDVANSGTFSASAASRVAVGVRSTMTSGLSATSGSNTLTNIAGRFQVSGNADTQFGIYSVATAPAPGVCTLCESAGLISVYGIYAEATGGDLAFSGYFGAGNFQVDGVAAFGSGVTITGGLLVTGEVNGYTQVTKSSDQDVTNSSTLADDSSLQFSTAAGKTYAIDGFIAASGDSTAGDYKWALATGTGNMDCSGTQQSLTTADAIQNSVVIATAATVTTSTSVGTRADASIGIGIRFNVVCKTASTTTLKFQFAQAAATPAKLARTMAGSYIRYKQLN